MGPMGSEILAATGLPAAIPVLELSRAILESTG